MIRLLINNWWLLAIRGGFALAFAVFVFVLQPFLSTLFLKAVALTGLTVLFGLFASVCGMATILAALRGAERKRGLGLLLADGIAVTAAGLVLLLAPGLTLLHVVRIIAGTAAIVGLLEIVIGVRLRRHLLDEWLLLAGGVASLAFAVFLLFGSLTEVSVVLNWTGGYALVNGAAMVGLALRLRGLRNSVHAMADAGAAGGVAAGHHSRA